MPKGKKGPVPIDLNDPTPEEIVGAENVVDVGTVEVGAIPTAADYAALAAGYHCSLPGCAFTSNLLSEIEEHVNGTGHGGYQADTPAPDNNFAQPDLQPELFSELGKIYRTLPIPLSDEQLTALHAELGEICSESLGHKETIEIAKDKIKALETDMQEIRAHIRNPVEYKDIECYWCVFIEENCKKLLRFDTNAVVETRALSAEDRAAELAKVEKDNEPAAAAEVEEPSLKDKLQEATA